MVSGLPVQRIGHQLLRQHCVRLINYAVELFHGVHAAVVELEFHQVGR